MNEQTMVTVFLIALVAVHLVVGLLCLHFLKRDIKAQATRLDANGGGSGCIARDGWDG